MKFKYLSRKGFASAILILGVVGILAFLFIIYVSTGNGLDRFGLLGQKKQAEQTSMAAPSESTASIGIVETNRNLGDLIHFTYTLPKGIQDKTYNGKEALIQVQCYQGEMTKSNIVYGEAGRAIDARNRGFVIGGASSPWLNDPVKAANSADCVASLFHWTYEKGVQTYNPLATFSFTAAGKTP
jgi:hypothetical protein